MSVPAPEGQTPAVTPPAAAPVAPPVATPPAAPAPDAAAAAPPVDDKLLGPNGEKALQAERDARKELERRLAALAPLEKLATVLGGGDPAKAKSEIELLTERQTQFEEEVAKEREARWRAEVANDKGLTTDQASRLRGKTREELTADADALVATFGITPGTSGATPATPKPDPSQGARPGGEPDIDQQIRAAESKGDVRESIRLKTLKSMQPAK